MKNGISDNLTFWSEAHLASLSQSQVSEAEQTTSEDASCTHILELWRNINRRGFYGRTYPAYYPAATELISRHSLLAWSNAGMGGAIGCLTLNTSECPSDAVECSLSAVLETTTAPKYYLNPKALRGILRRAEKQKTPHPPALMEVCQ